MKYYCKRQAWRPLGRPTDQMATGDSAFILHDGEGEVHTIFPNSKEKFTAYVCAGEMFKLLNRMKRPEMEYSWEVPFEVTTTPREGAFHLAIVPSQMVIQEVRIDDSYPIKVWPALYWHLEKLGGQVWVTIGEEQEKVKEGINE